MRRRSWRAADQHTGIEVTGGIPSTYQHIVGRVVPSPMAWVYRIEAFIEFVAPTPLHRNVYYVPGDRLDAFFDGWGEHAEQLIDIRPLTRTDADAELAAFVRQHR